MTPQDIQSFVNGFASALQLPAPEARITAIRERTEKGLRLGVSILPYPEKVRQVVAMQHRLVPIYAARGKVIVPWTLET